MFDNKITKTIFIEGMSCEHCSKRIEEAIMSIKGVKSVSVSLKEKNAEVVLKTGIEDEFIKSVIEDIGFKVTEIKNNK